jgi:sugar phosphate isomerase/epimerase
MAQFILSAFADEYSTNLDNQIAGLKQNGMGCIEIRGVNGKNISALDRDELISAKEKLTEGGIKVSAIGSPIGKIEITDDFEEHKKLFKKITEAAKILETNLIRVFSFYIPSPDAADDYRDEVFKRLDYLITAADKDGLTLCHENEAKIYGESPERCLDLLRNFGGRLKCVFDPGNFVLGGYKTYPYAYNMLKPYIRYFHIKDAKYDGTVVIPGKGDAKIFEILKDFADGAGTVLVTLEPHLRYFLGLAELNARSDVRIDNQFDSAESAFNAAADNLKEIINNI